MKIHKSVKRVHELITKRDLKLNEYRNILPPLKRIKRYKFLVYTMELEIVLISIPLVNRTPCTEFTQKIKPK